MKRRFPLLVLLFCSVLSTLALAQQVSALPEGFVYLERVVPGIQLELRYYGENNFVGRRIDGYEASVGILAEPAARALAQVQAELKPFGLGLKVFDAYRPQRAVTHFARWAEDLDDTRMRSIYYPDVDKRNLFRDGYIARKSGHSRGSTVDLTIVALGTEAPQELDMGSGFDFFSPVSWPDSTVPTPTQRAHRMLLQTLMRKHGFEPLREEWWHFTLRDEPYPKQYFDFPVR